MIIWTGFLFVERLPVGGHERLGGEDAARADGTGGGGVGGAPRHFR